MYACIDFPGWALTGSHWPYQRNRFTLAVTARRSDAAREPAQGVPGEGNWELTQQFAQHQSSLAASYAVQALLDLYGERLAKLRDSAGVRRWPKRSVRDARALDSYLTTDGLDAATITADVDVWTSDVGMFRRNVPDYNEDLSGNPALHNRVRPGEFVPELCAALRQRAARLAVDTANTTGNIRGSAELRQAVANTLLQRAVVGLSVAAVVIALISLLVAV